MGIRITFIIKRWVSTDERNACAHWWPGFGVDPPPPPPPPLLPAAMATPMATATPAATHQAVFEDARSCFFSAVSPVLPASNASVSGFGTRPGTVVILGHVSQVSAAIPREKDPRLMVRKQAAQRIATTDLIEDRRGGPRMLSPLWKRHLIVTNSSICGNP